MGKMLFNTESGNLYEVLVRGGGPDHRSFRVEIWSEQKRKWTNAGLDFDTIPTLSDEEVIRKAKDKAEQSVWE